MAEKVSKVPPYGFDPSFEIGLITALCSRPKLWGVIGSDLDRDALVSAPAKLAFQAAAAIAKDCDGKGPEKPSQVLQRLRRWQGEGKTPHAEIAAVADMFDNAEDTGLLSDAAYTSEVAPILSRRLQTTALDAALMAFGARSDMSKAIKQLERAKTIGTQTTSLGSTLGAHSVELISKIAKMDRMLIGIQELDDGLGGGSPRGTLTMFMAPAGGGKSVSLIMAALAAVIQGFHVGFVTLELPEYIQHARMLACLSATPIDVVMADTAGCGALEALDTMMSEPDVGFLRIVERPAKTTTMGDIIAWIADCESDWGAQMDVLVIDYADKLKAKGLSDKAQENSYMSSGSVYEDLYLWARDNQRWCITASQVTRDSASKRKRIVLDNVSDSLNKVRTADIVIAINKSEDGQVTFGIEKNRLGKGEVSVGPLPCDFSCAQIGPFVYRSVLDTARARRRVRKVRV